MVHHKEIESCLRETLAVDRLRDYGPNGRPAAVAPAAPGAGPTACVGLGRGLFDPPEPA